MDSTNADMKADREGQATALLYHLRKLGSFSADIYTDLERLNEQLFGKVHEDRGLKGTQATSRPSSVFPEMSILADSIASNLDHIHAELQSIFAELPKVLKETR